MKKIFYLLSLAFPLLTHAQPGEEPRDTAWKQIYRESSPKINNLVHTKLDVKFDYSKSQLIGKEWLTLQPHFYPTDSLLLDAKGMEIKELAMMSGTTKIPLKYTYDSQKVNIKLNRLYTRGEKYTLYINYISKPNDLKAEGSAAITDAKGLYFVNPLGEDKNKPTQIWTQGETESNSAWMLTIDKPNQKSTQELTMTVPDKYVTLSNGLLISKKKNTDGTRTDYWKMDLPHAPYLFFMGVGDFAIIKDTYKGKEVSYYVEKEYAPYARKIFGSTPEMMKFFSEKLGVEYPWAKYSQMVARDYVSGAMENTTATLHQQSAQQNSRQLLDGNAWEETIAHELFHQWFGDLVTAESWSNLTVNESFANYSEYLWNEYKYGKDYADEHSFSDMQGYLMSGSEQKELVRHYYPDKEAVFDAVSYNKGGRILHMLRSFVGDDAFFKSLNNYLTTNKFKTGEAAQLRLAFEEVTGKDLGWFFNQWYYGSGHPKLKISYNSEISGMPGVAEVVIEQTQKSGNVFRLPIAIDVFTNGTPKRYHVWLKNKADTFYFNVPSKPEWISVDAERILLAERTDNKTDENYVNQFKYAKNYMDRRDALDYFAKKNMPDMTKGLRDKSFHLRRSTINKLATSSFKADPAVLSEIEGMATKDSSTRVRAAAIDFLVKNGDRKYLPMYQKAVTDSSYSVAGAALKGLAILDSANAYAMARQFGKDAKGSLGSEANKIMLASGTEADFEFIAGQYEASPPSQDKIGESEKFAEYLVRVNDISKVKRGIDHIISFRNMIPEQYRSYVDPPFKAALEKVSKAKGAEIQNYIEAAFK